MSEYFSAMFWKRVLERAIKSFGQGAVAGATVVSGATDLSWVDGAVMTGASMAVLSVLTSIATANIGPDDTPSVV